MALSSYDTTVRMFCFALFCFCCHWLVHCVAEGFNKSSTVVIPHSVDVDDGSLRVSGKADQWSVHWTPVTVPRRSVYYRLTQHSNKLSNMHHVRLSTADYHWLIGRYVSLKFFFFSRITRNKKPTWKPVWTTQVHLENGRHSKRKWQRKSSCWLALIARSRHEVMPVLPSFSIPGVCTNEAYAVLALVVNTQYS